MIVRVFFSIHLNLVLSRSSNLQPNLKWKQNRLINQSEVNFDSHRLVSLSLLLRYFSLYHCISSHFVQRRKRVIIVQTKKRDRISITINGTVKTVRTILVQDLRVLKELEPLFKFHLFYYWYIGVVVSSRDEQSYHETVRSKIREERYDPDTLTGTKSMCDIIFWYGYSV